MLLVFYFMEDNMSDLEKWKKFLDEMGIKYEEDETTENIFDDNGKIIDRIPEIDIRIDDSYHYSRVYCPSLTITFNIDGSFKYFYPSGE